MSDLHPVYAIVWQNNKKRTIGRYPEIYTDKNTVKQLIKLLNDKFNGVITHYGYQIEVRGETPDPSDIAFAVTWKNPKNGRTGRIEQLYADGNEALAYAQRLNRTTNKVEYRVGLAVIDRGSSFWRSVWIFAKIAQIFRIFLG